MVPKPLLLPWRCLGWGLRTFQAAHGVQAITHLPSSPLPSFGPLSPPSLLTWTSPSSWIAELTTWGHVCVSASSNPGEVGVRDLRVLFLLLYMLS